MKRMVFDLVCHQGKIKARLQQSDLRGREIRYTKVSYFSLLLEQLESRGYLIALVLKNPTLSASIMGEGR